MPLAIFKLYLLLLRERPNATHSHFLPGGLIGLTASWLARIQNRYYTRRHGSQHSDMSKKGLIYDHFMNTLATKIVATGETVKEILIKVDKVNPNKIDLIHHGFQFSDFDNISSERVHAQEARYSIGSHQPVIGVISRYIELKGVQFIIPAFKKFLIHYPNALLLMSNTFGDYKPSIDQLLTEIPNENYRQIIFEKDIFAFYKLLDMFIHVPINPTIEAFGQIYVEALASRVPSIFTIAGVAREFVVHEKNALVVDYNNSEAIYEAMMRIASDQGLRNRIVENGYKDVRNRFGFENMIKRLELLYSGRDLK